MYRRTHLSVKGCVKMGLNGMQGYYRKLVEDIKEMAENVWKRKDWYTLFRGGTASESDNDEADNNDDNDDDYSNE